MNGDDRADWTQGEVVRRLTEIAKKLDSDVSRKSDLTSYRELADKEHEAMRDDISGIRDGLRWAFRLGVTLVGTELLAIIAYIIEQSIRSKP